MLRLQHFALLCLLTALTCTRVHAQDIYDCYNGSSEQGGNRVTVNGIQTNQYVQQSWPGATVTVYVHNTLTLATLFSDAAGTVPLANPFTSSAHGVAFVCIVDGRYDFKYSGSTITTPFTVSDIKFCFACTGGGGGSGTVNGTPPHVAKFTSPTAVGDSSGLDPGDTPTQWPLGLNVVGGAGYLQKDAGTGGVVANELVEYDSSGSAIVATVGSTAVRGIADVSVALGAAFPEAVWGSHAVIVDNQTAVNDFACPSSSIAGQASDVGATQPTSCQIIGRFTSANTGAGTLANIELPTTLSISPGSSGGSGIVSPCASSTSNAFYLTPGTIINCDSLATDDGVGHTTALTEGLTDTTSAGFWWWLNGPLPGAPPANAVQLTAPASIATSYTWVLPDGITGTGSVGGCLEVASIAGAVGTLDIKPCGSGSVSSFSAGNLSPLFTTSVATATTTPALTFTLSNAAANTVFGNFTGSSGAPSYNAVTACGDSTHALSWTAGTGFACQTISSGSNPIGPVRAATITALPFSPTYSNGTAGVGATLTATTFGALTIDGYTVLLNDRVLIKNQASSFQNGTYTLTTLGTGGVDYVLTRTTDFDTATKMNQNGAVPVETGTTNSTTLWVLTTYPLVITVGSDGLSFTQFGSSGGVNAKTCVMIFGADNGSTLGNTDIAPQGRQCFIPQNATITEVDVAADAGTPSVIADVNHAGVKSNILGSALATAASGGIACSNTTGVTGLDGATTCSATLQNTAMLAGDYLETVSATAGGTAKRMSIFVTFTLGGFPVSSPGTINSGNDTDLASYSGTGTTIGDSGISKNKLPLLLETHTASTSASMVFTTCLTNTNFTVFRFDLNRVLQATNTANLFVRASTNGGSTYDSSALYDWQAFINGTTGTTHGGGSAQTAIVLYDNVNGTAGAISGYFYLYTPAGSQADKAILGAVEATDSGTRSSDFISGGYTNTSAVNAIQFIASAGNITSGTITCTGVTQ